MVGLWPSVRPRRRATVAYGGVNTAVSAAVRAGLIRPDGGYDPEAMRGHAYLWDPLFFTWGTALVLALWLSRDSSADAR